MLFMTHENPKYAKNVTEEETLRKTVAFAQNTKNTSILTVRHSKV
jgi:hypothetical protein